MDTAEEVVKVTIDTNCIIALDENRPQALVLRQLISLSDAKRIELRVPAISASEKQKDNRYLGNFKHFKERLVRLGLESAKIIYTLNYLGVTYIGTSVLGGPTLMMLEREIHEILAPNRPIHWSGDIKENSESIKRWHKWRNTKCDVMAFWSHVWYGGGIFVSDDANFSRKKDQLINLAGGAVITSDLALETIKNNSALSPYPEDLRDFIKRIGPQDRAPVPQTFGYYWNMQKEREVNRGRTTDTKSV